MCAQVLDKSGLKPRDVDALITNCCTFNPVPSLSAVVVNHFKFKQSIKTYHLGGMGCAASVIAMDLAHELLQVCWAPNRVSGKDMTHFGISCNLPITSEESGSLTALADAVCEFGLASCLQRWHSAVAEKHACLLSDWPGKCVQSRCCMPTAGPAARAEPPQLASGHRRLRQLPGHGVLRQPAQHDDHQLVRPGRSTPARASHAVGHPSLPCPGHNPVCHGALKLGVCAGYSLFRLGGVAALLSNHPADRSIAKYRLDHLVRTHLGADDDAYKCAPLLSNPVKVRLLSPGPPRAHAPGRRRRRLQVRGLLWQQGQAALMCCIGFTKPQASQKRLKRLVRTRLGANDDAFSRAVRSHN